MSNYFDWPSNEPQRLDPEPTPSEPEDRAETPINGSEQAAEAQIGVPAPISDVESDDDGAEELAPMIGIVSAMLADGEIAEGSEPEAIKVVEPSAATLNAPTPRIALLSAAIDRHPEAPANYVLRAEAYLELAKYEQAAQDFTTALQIAQERATDWEYLNRSVLDRARQGLRRIEIEG